MEKRYELSKRNKALQEFEKDKTKVRKDTVQSEYRAQGAREMAQQRRDARTAATEAATAQFDDPRRQMTSADLRADLESRTGRSKF